MTKRSEILRTPIVFLHIPKCGGSAVDTAIRDAYGVGLGGRVNPLAARSAAQLLLCLPYPQLFFTTYPRYQEFLLLFHIESGYQCVSGHLPVTRLVLEHASSTHAFITVLRDPVERWMSHYIFNKLNFADELVLPSAGYAGPAEEELETVLDSWRGLQLGHMMTTMLTGRCPESAHIDAAVEEAIRNLKDFRLVGFLDALPEFARRFESVFSVGLRFSHVNRTEDSARDKSEYISLKALFTDDVRRRVADLCSADYRVYRAAQSLFR